MAILAELLIQAYRSARQTTSTSESLAVSVVRDANLAFWTRTVWSEEAAMRAFMRSGAHRHVMSRLPEWCDEAAVAASEPPSWSEACWRLQQD
jgi:hypothetical protein